MMKLGKIEIFKEAAVQLRYRVLKEKQKGVRSHLAQYYVDPSNNNTAFFRFLHSEVRLVMSVYLTYTLYR